MKTPFKFTLTGAWDSVPTVYSEFDTFSFWSDKEFSYSEKEEPTENESIVISANSKITIKKPSSFYVKGEIGAIINFGPFVSVAGTGADTVTYDAQHPLPTNGDSVYAKDIDLLRSNLGGFDGIATDFFDDLHSENKDVTVTNPKLLTIHFQRTIKTQFIGIGSSEGGDFSNVKIIGILSGGVEEILADYSDDNTKKTTESFIVPNTGLNAIRFEFYTADPIGITNLYIQKSTKIIASLEASVKYGSNYGAPYLLDGASESMNVNGSVTPVDFVFTATGEDRSLWNRSFIDLQDGVSIFQSELFGALPSLTNGVQIIVEKDGIETIIETRKTNMDISMTCYDFTPPYKTGAYIGRRTISSDMGGPITLFAGDKIICRINDNLTGLDAFRFRVKLSV